MTYFAAVQLCKKGQGPINPLSWNSKTISMWNISSHW